MPRLPPTALEGAVRVYFSSFVRVGNNTFAREDVFDQGAGYRAFVALPGGLRGRWTRPGVPPRILQIFYCQGDPKNTLLWSTW